MRHYETIFIISPDIAEEDTQAVMDRYQGILTQAGGFVAKVDPWGRRKLAYEVKGHGKGFYVLFDYGATPEAVTEMERNFKIDDAVIRFLTVKQSDDFDLAAAQAAQEAQEAQAAEPAAEPAAEAEPSAEPAGQAEAETQKEPGEPEAAAETAEAKE
jgi:small subunit ribosomal protein S6